MWCLSLKKNRIKNGLTQWQNLNRFHFMFIQPYISFCTIHQKYTNIWLQNFWLIIIVYLKNFKTINQSCYILFVIILFGNKIVINQIMCGWSSYMKREINK